MEILLLKSGACLAILMLFYKLVLENQSFHQFKRFYLLGAVIASLIIPFVSFTQYLEVSSVENLDLSTALTPLPNDNELQDIEVPINYWPIILWLMYGLGVLVFLIRFVKNLSRLLIKIKVNEKIKKNSYTEVLLKQLEPPHTFFNYIFFNRDKIKAKTIPDEVVLHEASHARQKHSLDILFVEILQIVFWFNPLLYFIKKDIKLNHEFLADAEVLNNDIESTHYKKILLT